MFKFGKNDKLKLKVKLKSLAAEIRIIKDLIRKQPKPQEGHCRWGTAGYDLKCHLDEVVRPEIRATHLAYAFLSGKKIWEVEYHWAMTHRNDHYFHRDVHDRARRIALKYSNATQRDLITFDTAFYDWLNALVPYAVYTKVDYLKEQRRLARQERAAQYRKSA